jgi:5-methylcytosine-specific restriction enzyme A
MRDRREEFSPAVRRAAFQRCGGRCEQCTVKLTSGNIFYDHRIPWALSRDSSLSNSNVLCRTCHDAKTYRTDIPTIAHVKRMADRHFATKALASQPMPCGRNTGFKRTMRGKVVARFTMGQMLRQMGLVR